MDQEVNVMRGLTAHGQSSFPLKGIESTKAGTGGMCTYAPPVELRW